MTNGSIHLITGPMFSGKTTELIRVIERYRRARKTAVVIKHSFDTRFSQKSIVTHDKIEIPAISVTSLGEIKDDILDVQVIGIDEGQFFTDLAPFCNRMADSGKIVIIAALNGTFERKPFTPIPLLYANVEQITKLSAICDQCGEEAHYTYRIQDNIKEEVFVGGAKDYEALCRGCFNKMQHK